MSLTRTLRENESMSIHLITAQGEELWAVLTLQRDHALSDLSVSARGGVRVRLGVLEGPADGVLMALGRTGAAAVLFVPNGGSHPIKVWVAITSVGHVVSRVTIDAPRALIGIHHGASARASELVSI